MEKFLLLYWGRKGGGAKYSYELAKAFDKCNVDYNLSLSNNSEYIQEFKNLQKKTLYLDTYTNKYQFIINSFLLPFKLFAFFSYVKKNEIKHILCTMHHLWSPFVSIISKYLGINYILIVHDANLHPGDGGFFLQFLLNTDIKQSKKIFCLSRNVKIQIEEKLINKNKNILIFPHGPFFYSNDLISIKKESVKNFLFFGRISKYKGIELLLDSWSILNKSIPDSKLFIYGNGEMSSDIKKRINLDKSITLVNRWIEENEVVNIFKKSDVCLLPYLESSQSGVMAISSALGIPVIITPEIGLIEQIQDLGCGLISESFKPADFASKTLELVNNINLYNKLANEGLLRSNKNSWVNISKNMLEHIF